MRIASGVPRPPGIGTTAEAVDEISTMTMSEPGCGERLTASSSSERQATSPPTVTSSPSTMSRVRPGRSTLLRR